MDSKEILELKLRANLLRQDIILELASAGSGHLASPLDLADLYVLLFFKILKYKVDDPTWNGRDLLFISNGHTVPVYYAVLSMLGIISREELFTLRKFGSRLQGHPERTMLNLLESTSGPLGSGLSQAAGYAYKLQYLPDGLDKDRYVYVTLGDGELDEGNIWEAVMFAFKYKLSKLIAIVDKNDIQLAGRIKDVMPLDSIVNKFKAFNWNVFVANGHDFMDMYEKIDQAKRAAGPSVIILQTIASYGVSFLEGKYEWHGRVLEGELKDKALSELREKEKVLLGESL